MCLEHGWTVEREIQAKDMYGSDKEALEALNGKHQALLAEIGKVIVGQEQVIGRDVEGCA